MKKILALVLAVAMLSTVAVAADNIISSPGYSDEINPGTSLFIKGDAFTWNMAGKANRLDDSGYRLSNEYFAVTTQKFDKGPGLVKSVKINDDKQAVEITLVDNYELSRPAKATAAPNLVIKEISIKAKKSYLAPNTDEPAAQVGKPGDHNYKEADHEHFKKGAIYTYSGAIKAFWVGYGVAAEGLLDVSPAYLNGEMVKFKVGADKTIVYADASLNVSDVYIEGRVYDKDKVFVEVDYKANTDVLKANENATINFINVTTNGFPTSNKIQITADEKAFIYKLVEGKLVESGLTWSADDYTWNGKIRSTTAYVISDIKLNAVAAAEDVKNPATGANDVVGIAAALAVVSLVAAGAVSLKK